MTNEEKLAEALALNSQLSGERDGVRDALLGVYAIGSPEHTFAKNETNMAKLAHHVVKALCSPSDLGIPEPGSAAWRRAILDRADTIFVPHLEPGPDGRQRSIRLSALKPAVQSEWLQKWADASASPTQVKDSMALPARKPITPGEERGVAVIPDVNVMADEPFIVLGLTVDPSQPQTLHLPAGEYEIREKRSGLPLAPPPGRLPPGQSLAEKMEKHRLIQTIMDAFDAAQNAEPQDPSVDELQATRRRFEALVHRTLFDTSNARPPSNVGCDWCAGSESDHEPNCPAVLAEIDKLNYQIEHLQNVEAMCLAIAEGMAEHSDSNEPAVKAVRKLRRDYNLTKLYLDICGTEELAHRKYIPKLRRELKEAREELTKTKETLSAVQQECDRRGIVESVAVTADAMEEENRLLRKDRDQREVQHARLRAEAEERAVKRVLKHVVSSLHASATALEAPDDPCAESRSAYALSLKNYFENLNPLVFVGETQVATPRSISEVRRAEDAGTLGIATILPDREERGGGEPIPPDAEHMGLDEFIHACATGGYVDDDGSGCYATDDRMYPARQITPGAVMSGEMLPPWVTHVVWFNK